LLKKNTSVSFIFLLDKRRRGNEKIMIVSFVFLLDNRRRLVFKGKLEINENRCTLTRNDNWLRREICETCVSTCILYAYHLPFLEFADKCALNVLD